MTKRLDICPALHLIESVSMSADEWYAFRIDLYNCAFLRSLNDVLVDQAFIDRCHHACLASLDQARKALNQRGHSPTKELSLQ